MLPVTAQAIISAEKLKVTYFKLSWIFLGGGEDKLVLPCLDIRNNNHAVVYSKASNLSVFIIFFFHNRNPWERRFSSQKLGAQEQLATAVSTPTSATSSRKVSSKVCSLYGEWIQTVKKLQKLETNPFSFNPKQKSLKCHGQLCTWLWNKQQADA